MFTFYPTAQGAPKSYKIGQANRYLPVQWLAPLLDGFAGSAADQQVHLVDTFFKKLDFRRFQVDLNPAIALDQPSEIPAMEKYGEELGNKLLKDKLDRAHNIVPERPRIPRRKASKSK